MDGSLSLYASPLLVREWWEEFSGGGALKVFSFGSFFSRPLNWFRFLHAVITSIGG
jgi:hypothetical protein